MDQQRFDEITRALASGTNRRTVLRRLGAVLGGALALGGTSAFAAPKEGGGKPQGRCAAGFTNCRGTCVDLQGDRDHCGACATACPDATVCLGGTCACAGAGELYIGGACYDLANDPHNCGGVGNACSGSMPHCAGGACIECTQDGDCTTQYCLQNVCAVRPTLSVEAVLVTEENRFYYTVGGSGLMAGSPVTMDDYMVRADPVYGFIVGYVDVDGEFWSTVAYGCGTVTRAVFHATAADGSLMSESTPSAC